jgi:hypothetical protein
MKLMDLFERYSGRLTVNEANAKVVIEIFGQKMPVESVHWTKGNRTLVLGVDEAELERKFTPEIPA